eukprot:scaffold61307_cov32-Tisochrysis_lutea.AAC.3
MQGTVHAWVANSSVSGEGSQSPRLMAGMVKTPAAFQLGSDGIGLDSEDTVGPSAAVSESEEHTPAPFSRSVASSRSRLRHCSSTPRSATVLIECGGRVAPPAQLGAVVRWAEPRMEDSGRQRAVGGAPRVHLALAEWWTGGLHEQDARPLPAPFRPVPVEGQREQDGGQGREGKGRGGREEGKQEREGGS